MTKTIKQECPSCHGTGLYSGFCEGPGKAVVCHGCNGRGWNHYTYTEFTGRKHKRGIRIIQESRGSLIIGPMGGGDNPEMTYKEFEATYPVDSDDKTD